MDMLRHNISTTDDHSVSQDATVAARLLHNSAGAILDMATVALETEVSEASRIFYNHLRCNCIRLADGSKRTRDPSSPWVSSGLLDQLLDCLGSLICDAGSRGSTTYAVSSISRLNTLVNYWTEVRNQEGSAKQDFVSLWLRSKELEDGDVNGVLERHLDELDKEQPKKIWAELGIGSSPQAGSNELSTISEEAEQLFNALLDTRCSCHFQDNFQAELEISTYRKPKQTEKKTSDLRTQVFSQKRTRNIDTFGGLSFSMVIFIDGIWKEILIHHVGEQDIRYSAATSSRTQSDNKRVDQLCIPLAKVNNSQRLALWLSQGRLYEEGKQRVIKAVESVSLSQLFEQRRERFTEKTKRIISLLVSYAVLHLRDTPWLQLGWNSSNIKFFRTTSSTIPLRAFIQASIGKNIDGHDEPMAPLANLDGPEPCATILSLAVVLMEVYFLMPFERLAGRYNIPLEDGPVAYVDVLQTFYGDNDSNIEGWCSHIPDDARLLLQAIENCLDAELWTDEEGQALDCSTIRSRLHQHVIQPLQLYLSQGFSEIPLSNIDEYARRLDLEKWGQPIDNRIAAPNTRSSSFRNHDYCSSRPFPEPGNSSQIPVRSKATGIDYKELQFFDDSLEDGDNSKSKLLQYKNWRTAHQEVCEKFIEEHLLVTRARSQLVKIAILDTGIDIENPYLEAQGVTLGGQFNCYDKFQKNVKDKHGHGTCVSGLILDYAANAMLYVVKITDKENLKPKGEIVAEAIHHAVDWDVDIISMSFGWPSADFDGRDAIQAAIDRAHGKKILMFAAASNSGGRRGRAYPASSPGVICVHSTGVNGGRSDFSPTAELHKHNFATVGEAVETVWPVDANKRVSGAGSSGVRSRSGTSYATAVLVGIAAFLLQFAQVHLPKELAEQLRRKEKMEALLQKCAERGPDATQRDGYSYVHLSLDRNSLFGRSLDWIKSDIAEMLRTL